MLTPSVQRAYDFAVARHGAQKYGERPYSHHLFMVHNEIVLNCHPYHPIEILEQAAFLHDVLEDTKTSFRELEDRFGFEVAMLVELVTDEPGENREERKKRTYEKTRRSDLSVFLKLADRTANVISAKSDRRMDKLHLYREEHSAFRRALEAEGAFSKMWRHLETLLTCDRSLHILAENRHETVSFAVGHDVIVDLELFKQIVRTKLKRFQNSASGVRILVRDSFPTHPLEAPNPKQIACATYSPEQILDGENNLVANQFLIS